MINVDFDFYNLNTDVDQYVGLHARRGSADLQDGSQATLAADSIT
jgi:hypothetical protein